MFCGAPLKSFTPIRKKTKKITTVTSKQVPSSTLNALTFVFHIFFLSSISVLYILGWGLEDKKYWLADEALYVWVGAIPIFTLLFSFFTKYTKQRMTVIFMYSSFLLFFHTVIMFGTKNRFNDDYIGIAAMIAGAFYGSFLIGKVFRKIVFKKYSHCER